jgi:hypothetical protein
LSGIWYPFLEPVPENATAGDCGPVYGELLTFDDPEIRFPAIDRLEGFSPNARSLYRRALVLICIDGRMVPSWLCANGPRLKGGLKELKHGLLSGIPM